MRALAGSTLAFAVLAACGYDFGGSPDGNGGASTTLVTHGSGETSSAVTTTAEATSGTPASGSPSSTSPSSTSPATTADAATTQASTTSGVVVASGCFPDDFSNFDGNNWEGNLDQDGSGPGADAVAEGPNAGAFRSYPMSECFASVTFDADTGARIYLDARQEADVFGVGIVQSGAVELYEGTTAIASTGAPVHGVDAIGLVFAQGMVTAYYRDPGGWLLLGSFARPPWLDDAVPEISGFGIYSSGNVTQRFHDFSLANPTN